MGKARTYLYNRRRATRKGRRDGRGFKWIFWPFFKRPTAMYPLVDQKQPAEYENELLKLSDKVLGEIAEEWKELDLRLKPAYCKALKLYQQAQRDWVEACRDVTPLRVRYEKAKSSYDELPAPAWPVSAEIAVTLLMVLLEGPGLAYAYQLFGASKLETYLMAGLAVFTVPLAAVLFGHKLKKESRNNVDRGILIAIPTVFLAAMLGFTLVRAGLFEMTRITSTFETTLDNGTVSAVFFFVNLLAFVICTAVSYKCAHRDPEKHRLRHRHLLEAKRLLEQATGEVEGTQQERDSAELQLIKAQESRRKYFEILQSRAEYSVEVCELLVQMYRTANIAARSDGKAPPCFLTDPHLVEIPEILLKDALEWDCPEMGTPNFDLLDHVSAN